MFAYQGWAYLNSATEEVVNPTRNLPLAIMISMSICTAVYVAFNAALYVVVTPDEMLINPAAAVIFSNKVYGKFNFIIPLCVSISTFGSSNGIIMMSSRLYFAGAREGHMPAILAMTNKHLHTPIPAVILMSTVSIIYIFIGDVFVLINASQVTALIAYIAVALALIWLRHKMPDAPRPVKVNLAFPVVFIIGSAILVVSSVQGAPKDTSKFE
ncbi:unnamed protein product [Heligmosomoides polygyrus]|uniref:AA_permease domain-containing protein n=1 Tax=Heligmosomoides polygyrus TaxID=6339 RepID=A0A183GHD9_HELPZ|nr:unnamed protein product [Heligmosomoides polygyrus]